MDGCFAVGVAADVVVIVVTHNSARVLDRLLASLRAETRDQRIRVVIADNASTDHTLAVARAHEDVIVLDTGGNLGYAGGINAAMRAAGDTGDILVLNPDLEVAPDCIAALRKRMTTTGAGIVVPRIVDESGVLTASLRSEPSIVRALGDAMFGGRVQRRPAALSETVFAASEYESARRVQWATGAALLIDRAMADQVGPWDERYFLYSEETDYFRRARELGASIWYEPEAVVRHDQGGSGASLDLDRLMAVNRIRYARAHHGVAVAAMFRAVVVLHEFVRSRDDRHRAVLRTVSVERTWADLPRAQRSIAEGS